jgi:hypothetical protein
MYKTNKTKHLNNIPEGLNDKDLQKAILKRINDIDICRRSVKSQLNLATANNEKQKIKELSKKSKLLLNERFALHDEYKQVKQNSKRSNYQKNSHIPESLAIEFMLIAQKKMAKNFFEEIRNEAAMNIVVGLNQHP